MSNERRDRIAAGQNLNVEDRLWSGNGLYYVIMQSDGNLVIKNTKDEFLWHTNTPRPNDPGFQCCLLHGSNLVLCDKNNKRYWETGTVGATGMYGSDTKLIMQDDGNLVVYGDGRAIWASRNGVQM